MGLFFLQLVRQQSSGPITVVDLQAQRLEVARQLGADDVVEVDAARGGTWSQQQAHSFDCVVDATGSPEVIEAAFRFLASESKLLLLGSPPTAASVAIHPRQIQRQDATVVGAYSFGHEFAAALELLQAGRVQTSPIVTHKFPLEDFPEAWEWASMGRDCIKVQIVP
jgi:threonine dehydrogenase-like Zn-dependent dehydrogenase